MPLSALFYPKSTAVIGASKEEGAVGYEISKNLKTQGYKGKLFLVNPKGGKLFGQKVIEDLSEIKHGIELAIVAIPAKLVSNEVKKLAQLKIKALIVISAGFSESGNEKGEEELAKICLENKITLVGPNCLGIINPQINLNASFAPLMPQKGDIAFISQSGALCASILDYAAREKIGFSKFISVGNKALVGETDLLEYFYSDPSTKVIGMYVEELENPELLEELSKRITRGKSHKPIVILKAGKTASGQKAALSHTGSMGGADTAYDSLFAQSGIIRAQTIEELFDYMVIFSRNKSYTSENVAVITNAGGPGVLSADSLTSNGLKLAKLSMETENRLREFLPKASSTANPVDILGDADSSRYEKTLELIINDPNVDALEIILTPQSMTEVQKTAQAIVKAKKHFKKPIIAAFMGKNLVEEGYSLLNKKKVATAHFPETAAKALSALNIFKNWQKADVAKPYHFKNISPIHVRQIIDKNNSLGNRLMSLTDSLDVLETYGFPVNQRWILKDKTSIPGYTKNLETPFVLKVLSRDINHKSDVGGVILGVQKEKISESYDDLIARVGEKVPKAKIQGALLMPMVKDDPLEIIIGAKTDARLGKQILVGLGGTLTEIFSDVSWGLAPLTKYDIERMIAHLKTAKILSGFRQHKPFAKEKIVECLARLSQLVVDFPEISEIDINPLMVMEKTKGALVVDARIVIN